MFDNVPTKYEKKAANERLRELTPYKRNFSSRYGRPTTNLQTNPILDHILQDDNRVYMHHSTHLHPGQFFLLAEHLKDLILDPQMRADGTRTIRHGRSIYHDHYHRLFFCLKWLNDGVFYKTREAEVGWGKSSLQEDCEHVLIVIVEGLEDELKCLDEGERARLAVAYEGIFREWVGIRDVKEFQIKKNKNCVKERRSWSGKINK
jgi:hypothetical protein